MRFNEFKLFEQAQPAKFYAIGDSHADMIARIKAADFDFKTIDFVADRYLIDIIDGQIEDKYLAFPQRGEKLP